jgi:hypothetical protein
MALKYILLVSAKAIIANSNWNASSAIYVKDSILRVLAGVLDLKVLS